MPIALGFAAILLSQSRAAFGIFVWALWMAVTSWRQTHARIKRQTVSVAGLVSVGFYSMDARRPLRLKEGWNEVVAAANADEHNSAIGVRVYSFSLAWNGFKELPWVGLSGRERLRRTKEAGTGLPPVAREVGYVHNQYIHAAIFGGLVGLASPLPVLGVSAVEKLTNRARVNKIVVALTREAATHVKAMIANVLAGVEHICGRSRRSWLAGSVRKRWRVASQKKYWPLRTIPPLSQPSPRGN